MYPFKHKTYTSLQEVTRLTRQLRIKGNDTEDPGGSEPVFRFSSSESFDDYNNSVYRIGEPFEKLGRLMFNIHEDKIKKRIVRNGKGPIISPQSIVTIDYKAYLANQDEPFDSTSKTGPYTLSLVDNHLLPGLCLAIQSMCAKEISQFLLNSQLAYGADSGLNFLPPDAFVLFVIEIKNIVDLNESKKESFRDIFIAAHAFCKKGNELFSKGLIKQAIKEFKNATSKLEIAKLSDNTDLEKQRQLLLRLYTNLVIAYTKLHETRSACSYSKTVYDMCRGTNLKVPVKVYINHARSLILLSKIKQAEQLLHEAEHLDPQNQEIAKEIFMLKITKRESNCSTKVMPVKSISLSNESEHISGKFKEAMTQYCIDLINDEKVTQYELPNGLNEVEQEYALAEMKSHGLYFKQCEVNGITKFFVSKSSTFWS